MIVRDSAKTLRKCLESIRPWVDELVVVDTGSLDETPQISQEFGAQLRHFPWIDDFAAARNASLRYASHEWVFWMDSDDTIEEEIGRRFRELVCGEHDPQTLGYVMQVHCPGERAGEMTVVDHVKLFRNHPQLRFEGRIHEQVLQGIRQLGGQVAWTDLFVVHSGADQSKEGKHGKYERDLRILELDLKERPDHPFVLFNFGMTYSDMGRHDDAIRYLRRCVEVSAENESHLRKAYALLVSSLAEAGAKDEARSLCVSATKLFPDDPELRFRQGILAHDIGNLELAADCYHAAMRGHSERCFLSIDRGIVGYKSRHNLALVYADQGRCDLAELQWRVILDERPDYRPAQRALGQMLLRQRKPIAVELLIEDLERHGHALSALLLHGELATARGEIAIASRSFDRAVQLAPKDPEVRETQSRFLFEHGSAEDALRAVQSLLRLRPCDASIYHNLGALQVRLGKLSKAIEMFEKSLELRPESELTRSQLAAARESVGDTEGSEESPQSACV